MLSLKQHYYYCVYDNPVRLSFEESFITNFGAIRDPIIAMLRPHPRHSRFLFLSAVDNQIWFTHKTEMNVGELIPI